ncbi:MAG TPA: leucyl aminopeptidase [Limnochordales bacterium]|nr:leucyl aminopeptidase [Limnochordales bacterium]
MEIVVQQGNITEAAADAVIVNLFEGVTQPGGATGALDARIGGLIRRLIANGELRGKLNETAVLHVGDGFPFRKVVVVGLGKASEFDAERVRQVSAAAAQAAARGRVKTIATIVHGAGIGGLDVAAAAQSVAEGTLLGLYRYDKYKTRREDNGAPDEGRPERVVVVEMDAGKLPVIRAAVERGVVLAEATNFARDLVNAPANELTPAELARRAQAMAEEEGLECTILDREEMARLGMGALLGVAQGSAHEPKLVVLRYRGGEGPPIALVGKGVTFDTGGISLKPSQGMGAMTSDMAGAAAVLGAMRAIARLKPRQHVIAVAPCVENMPSGTAQRPGDIVRAMTGKTIEIDNTDAEGRLILADAVAYAESLGAATIIDVATLTGACVVALGHIYTGLVSNDDALAEALMAAGRKAGERYCRLPADPEYKEQYKSDVADIKNTGGRPAGAITGALIISEFIDKARWAHLDIAGTARAEKARHYVRKGATGVAVRTLAEYVCSLG